MPWSVGDVDKHKKGLTNKDKKKWVSIANSVLESCKSSGGSDCEGKAIRIANSKVGAKMKDDVNVVNFSMTQKSMYDIETETNPEGGIILKEVPVFKTGTHRGCKYDEKYIDDVLVNNFDPKSNVPIQADHSDSYKDTLGYVRKLVRKGKMLYADMHLLADNAIARWKKGLMKKWSISFYLDKRGLREISAVAFPYVKEASVLSEDVEVFNGKVTDEQLDQIISYMGIHGQYDREQLRMGVEVEYEHGTKLGQDTNVTNDDLIMTARIAVAHLKEIPDYYDRLHEMEEEAGKTEEEEEEMYAEIIDNPRESNKTKNKDYQVETGKKAPTVKREVIEIDAESGAEKRTSTVNEKDTPVINSDDDNNSPSHEELKDDADTVIQHNENIDEENTMEDMKKIEELAELKAKEMLTEAGEREEKLAEELQTKTEEAEKLAAEKADMEKKLDLASVKETVAGLKKDGKVLPAEEEKVTGFIVGLSEEQRTEYIEILKAAEPKVDLKESGEQESEKEEEASDEFAVDFDEMSTEEIEDVICKYAEKHGIPEADARDIIYDKAEVKKD